MARPMMNPTASQSVSVPCLSGGINPGSVGEAVADNQLTDCLNVWAKGGEVITRPKLVEKVKAKNINIDYDSLQKIEIFFEGKKAFFAVDKFLNIIFFTADNSICIINNFCGAELQVNKFLLYSGTAKENHSIGAFLLVDFGEIKDIWEFTYHEGVLSYKGGTIQNKAYIPKVIINGWGNNYEKLPKKADSEDPKTTELEGYNLLSGGFRATYTTDSISHTFKLPELPKGKVTVEIDMSAVATNSTSVRWANGDNSQKLLSIYTEDYTKDSGFYKYNGDNVCEKVSLLTFTFEDGNSSSNESYYIDGSFDFYTGSGELRKRCYYRSRFCGFINRETGTFNFPFIKENKYLLKYKNGGTITETIQGPINNAESVTALTGTDENGAEITVNTADCYGAFFDINEGKFKTYVCTSGDEKTVFPQMYVVREPAWLVFPRSGNLLNNINVTVSGEINNDDLNKIIDNNISCSYGGTVGLNYGYRSFVGGNNHRIYFSDIDNPYYFPENCYFGIGSNNEKVTAFGKQSGYLVIFKENSIYYTYEEEVENNSSSSSSESEKVSNQAVIDITAGYRYRLFNLNSSVGCDLPSTIQLCMNRLIFACSDGNVYVLNSLSNYSERNIFLVSGLIRNRLVKFTKKEWEKAFAVDCNGYYMLFAGNDGFVLDYNKNEYKYVSSYTSNSAVSKYGLFSWWPWSFPKYLRLGCATDNSITLFFDGEDSKEFCTLDFNTPEDETESYIVTKFFDFSHPDYNKGINSVSLGLGNDYDSTVFVEFLTDAGERPTIPFEIYNTGQRGTASYNNAIPIKPKIKLCRKFGIKITADGPFALSSVIINYTLKGAIKHG